MAKINISTAYTMWRGSTDTKLPVWESLSDEIKSAITGTIRAHNYLKSTSDKE